MFTHRRKNIGEAKVGLTKHHSRVPPFIEKLRFIESNELGAFPKKGVRQDGGDTPKMRTCHCERSEAIFSIEIASSLALLAMT